MPPVFLRSRDLEGVMQMSLACVWRRFLRNWQSMEAISEFMVRNASLPARVPYCTAGGIGLP